MDLLIDILSFGIIFILFFVVIHCLLLLKRRFVFGSSSIIQLEDVPEELQDVFKEATVALHELGFEYAHTITEVSVDELAPRQIHHWFIHQSLPIHADVGPPVSSHNLKSYDVSFISSFPSGRAIVTSDGIDHIQLPLPDRILSVDLNLGDLKKQWEAHKEALYKSKIIEEAQVFTAEESRESSELMMRESLDACKAKGWMCDVVGSSGTLKFTFLGALKFTMKMILSQYKPSRNKVSKKEVKTKAAKPLNIDFEIEALNREASKPSESQGPSLKKILIFTISMLVFAISFGFLFSWSTAIITLVLVVTLHELGHYLGMVLFGYRDRQIFFIPFFGAAASGRKEEANPFQQLVVLLLGPIPGLVLGSMCIFSTIWLDYPYLKEFGMMAIILNYVNLFPVTPLDGGRIVEVLVLNRFPRAQFYFLLMSTLLIIWGAIGLKSIGLSVLALVLILSLPNKWHAGTVVKRLSKCIPLDMPKNEKLRMILHALNQPPFEKQHPEVKRVTAKNIVQHFSVAGPTLLLSIFGMMFYFGFLFVAPLVGSVAYVACTMDYTFDFEEHYSKKIDAAVSDNEKWSALIDAWQYCSTLSEDSSDAGAYLNQALELAESMGRGEDPYLHTNLIMHRLIEHPDLRRDSYFCHLEEIEDEFGMVHPHVAHILLDYVSNESEYVSLEEQIQFAQRALNIWEGLGTTTIDEQIRAINMLLSLYKKNQQWAVVEESFHHVNALYSSSLSTNQNYFYFIESVGSLGDHYVHTERHEKAIALIQGYLPEFEHHKDKISGFNIFKLYTQLAWIYVENEDYDSAKNVLEDTLQTFNTEYRDSYYLETFVVSCMIDTCYIELAQGNYSVAHKQFASLKKWCRENKEDPQTLKAFLNVQPEQNIVGSNEDSWQHRRTQARLKVFNELEG